MESKVIDINTIVANGITYTAVEHRGCTDCELRHQPECHIASCSELSRPDNRSIIWKRKTTDVQNKSSSEHTKSIDIKIVNENKIIIDGVEYQPTDDNWCAKCAFHGTVCNNYGTHIPCDIIERKEGRRVIWEKVSDKQIHVSLLEIKQTKKKVYKLNFKP